MYNININTLPIIRIKQSLIRYITSCVLLNYISIISNTCARVT